MELLLSQVNNSSDSSMRTTLRCRKTKNIYFSATKMKSVLALSVFLNQKAKTTGILVHPIKSPIDLLQVYSLLRKKKLDSLPLVLS